MNELACSSNECLLATSRHKDKRPAHLDGAQTHFLTAIEDLVAEEALVVVCCSGHLDAEASTASAPIAQELERLTLHRFPFRRFRSLRYS